MLFSERGQWGGSNKHLVVVTLCEQINVTIASLVPATTYVRNSCIENAQRVNYDSSQTTYTRCTLCTMGISRWSILKTTISPTAKCSDCIHRKRMSPRRNAGSILPLRTTTTGLSLLLTTIRNFHIMSADVTMRPSETI
jgi:hypothetical protein